MRILIYCAHPSQYHFYKHIIAKLNENGHKIELVIKTKDILESLVKEDGLEYKNILPEQINRSKSSLLFSLIKRDIRLFRIAKDFKPDILIGSDACNTHVARLLGKPGFVVGEDDYRIVKSLHWLMMPFASGVLTPEPCTLGPFEKKKIPFQGYMKLAYLHPSIFKPDKEIITKSGLNMPYCIIRLVKLNAHHDNRIDGLNIRLIKEIITRLTSNGLNVYIDSEDGIPSEFSGYLLKINKSWFHQILAFACLIISDSQSLSVEAAILGIPSIRINGFVGRISVLEELEHRYGLTYGIDPSDKSGIITKIQDLLSDPDLSKTFRKKRDTMLHDKINVYDFFVWFLDHFPDSWDKVKSGIVDNQFMNSLTSNVEKNERITV